jgi:hypothetical protein
MALAPAQGGNPNRPAPTRAQLPTIEVRFSPVYAWMLIGFGAIFFGLALVLGKKFPPLGVFIALASLAAMVGGNYWRQHLHVVARITPRHLILRREGSVAWTEIAQLEKKVVHVYYRGSHRSEFVCIRLTARRNVREGVSGVLDMIKTKLLGGYDLVVPGSELSCTVDSFIAECQKRMAATTSSGAPVPAYSSQLSG